MEHPVVLALLGTSFTFLATVAGAAMVFFVKKEASINTHKAFLGFAAGVMIAASVWSLLIQQSIWRVSREKTNGCPL